MCSGQRSHVSFPALWPGPHVAHVGVDVVNMSIVNLRCLTCDWYCIKTWKD
jgi:hypothetical protein